MNADLVALAEAHGVATWYEDWQRQRTDVSEESVIGVLGLLGVDASTPAAVRAALAEVRGRKQGGLPGTIVLRAGSPLEHTGQITLEDGRTLPADAADIPLGWHRLRSGDQEATLVVVPAGLPEPPETWGWMVQLYTLHSAESWGMGDLGDLRSFVAGVKGAGLVLLNPLHAITPVRPVPASPYSPSSRRFANPIYLRIADIEAYQRADGALRARVDALKPSPPADGLIDYDGVWAAKLAALELLWPLAGPVDLESDPGRTDFARFCALAEEHGSDWRTWPEELRRPDSAAVTAYASDRIAFHAWVQHLVEEQLVAAREAATGMPVGIVHDLAVGIDPGGADGWLLQDVLAPGVRAGAPPDAFNQLGQDWGLAAWRPDRLVATGYAAYRDMLRRIFRHAGGLRVDHVAGLWRLWWVPPGLGAAQGTYVHYDPEAMLGILTLEAHRAGAVVIGEDLGTVLPEVTAGLEGRNMLGSAVLWFTRDSGGDYLPAAEYPRNALASISTHDLPTAAGFLAGEQVRVRAELGQLAGPVEKERATWQKDRAELLDLLRAEGLLGDDPDTEQTVLAMHRFLARTPCRFVTASLHDVLLEIRQPNLPGTFDEYPNWRIPLGPDLADVIGHPLFREVAEILGKREPMGFLDKAKQLVDKHEDKVDKALDKIGDEVDRRTGHKHTSKIDRGVEEIKKRTGPTRS
ncbi:putative 4-alpha-glucanotransferase [Actinoplanes missouriensis 431]|uniref:4-alpha-glucanotransferase n=1 Tax=Actinoplanes missouriensis (strain ATCC 14538 / DSM 43046 / CBS 188.64 / JCM 3121 / NBRC 102363 / NCIMB 12654 / NRRL B-3342 / UNCC 431) TaxID=512565 RepID=I0HHP8_ACTM4|nr:4-alpha-glucanotransferase [Actinoplanes missouriensis]BAL92535.1 putative 4-alpha-glucanotransferase [Actinoplanes missouriensis 431]